MFRSFLFKCYLVDILLNVNSKFYLVDIPFDYTAVAVSGKVERSYTGLTTPVV